MFVLTIGSQRLIRLTFLTVAATLLVVAATALAMPPPHHDFLEVGSGDYIVGPDEEETAGTSTDNAIAIEINDGELILEAGATLTVRGHVELNGPDAKIVIRAGARLEFEMNNGQVFQVILNTSGQEIVFEGEAGDRGVIGKKGGAAGLGLYYINSVTSDTRFSGSFGRIEDAHIPVAVSYTHLTLPTKA